LKMTVMPEMVFGKNEISFEYGNSFKFSFNTFDAMKAIDNKAQTPKVKHADDWKRRYL